MLYDRWRQVVEENRDELALVDLAADRTWSFAGLALEAERGATHQRLACPQGGGGRFVVDLLRAWRAGSVTCPLEPGQAPPEIETFPADCAHLKLTSATTGLPRAIAFSAPQLLADAANITATMGLRRDWPNLGVISLAHSYGFSNLVLPLVLHGIPLVLLASPLPEVVRQASAQFELMTLPAVPALWRAWHEAGVIGPCIRLAISAGAPLPLALEEAIYLVDGLKVHNFYGASECGGIAYDSEEVPRRDAACVGTPLRGVEVAVNEGGCLQVRGGAVGMTYLPEPDEMLTDGRYQTSDLAEIREGRVFLQGRATDLINVAGRKVAPEAVERVLSIHPGVTECLIFGVPAIDAERGEMVVACFAARKRIDPEELKMFLLERLPAWQVPREWVRLESLPANQRGKLSRRQWRERYLAGELGI